jgi:hypothetical protein
VARYDYAAGFRRMLENIVVAAVPNNPTLSFQSGDNGAPVCIEGRLGTEAFHLCAIICAFSSSLSTTTESKHRTKKAPPFRGDGALQRLD